MDIKKETLEHYKRMQEWAKTQDLKNPVNYGDMYRAICENWGEEDCSYCSEYYLADDNRECGECPLNKSESGKSAYCCAGLWQRMNSSYSWKGWLEYSEKIVEFIKENG